MGAMATVSTLRVALWGLVAILILPQTTFPYIARKLAEPNNTE